jgi:hypothetical protein
VRGQGVFAPGGAQLFAENLRCATQNQLLQTLSSDEEEDTMMF